MPRRTALCDVRSRGIQSGPMTNRGRSSTYQNVHTFPMRRAELFAVRAMIVPESLALTFEGGREAKGAVSSSVDRDCIEITVEELFSSCSDLSSEAILFDLLLRSACAISALWT